MLNPPKIPKMMKRTILNSGIFALATSITMADFTPVTTITVEDVGEVRTLKKITVDGHEYIAAGLATGTTSSVGAASPGNIANMDNFNLNNLATGLGSPTYVGTILFGGSSWSRAVGETKPLDFFIFEGAGGANPDDIQLAAIFEVEGLDVLGVAVAAPTAIASPIGWGNTGLTLSGSQQSGQALAGLGWSITDLKDQAGNFLSASAVIKGIAITGGFGVDPCGLYAVVSPPDVFFDHLEIDVASPQTAGAAFDVTIRAEDINGAIVNDDTLVVTITSPTSGSFMEFDWNGDGTYDDNSGTLGDGEITIKARNKKAQTVSLVATQGSVGTTSPPNVTTVAGAFNKLQTLVPGETTEPGTDTGKAGTPVGQLQGVPFNITVTAVDANWNLVSSTDLIGITSSDATATLPASAPLVSGTATFSVVLNDDAEPYTITATDLTNGGITAGVSAQVSTQVITRWVGNGTTNVWDTSSLLWANPPNPTAIAFADATPALFDETGSASPAVNVGTVAPSAVIVDSTSKNYTFTGSAISGTATLTKNGASTLTLTADNTYTGDTTVSGGILKLGSANALPGGNFFDADLLLSSGLKLNGGVLGLAGVDGDTFTPDFTRAVGGGANQVFLTGNSGFAAFDEDKVLNFNGIDPPNTVFLGGASFLPNASDSLVLSHPTATHKLTILNNINLPGGSKVIHVENGSALIDATLEGKVQDFSANPGKFTKTGSGTLELYNTESNYEGDTLIRDGILALTGKIYFGVSIAKARVVLGDGVTSGVLQLGSENGPNDQTIGSLTVSGTGSNNAVVGGDEFDASVLTINTGGTVTYSGRLGRGQYNTESTQYTENNLALTKIGTGILELSGPSNTYMGDTRITAGTLALGASNVLPDPNPNNPDEVQVFIGNATLDAATFSDTVGSLNLTSASAKINLGSGGSLAFADSSASDWFGFGLNIIGSFVPGASIRFGTNASGLTEDQLALISINGVLGSYILNATGHLTIAGDPYDTWAGGAPFDGDANLDGVDNGLAWLLTAASPSENANGLLPAATANVGALVMEFDCLPGSERGTAVLSLEHSSNLGISDPWTTVEVPGVVGNTTVGGVNFVVTDPDPAGGPLNVVATIQSSEAAAGKLFGRLQGTR